MEDQNTKYKELCVIGEGAFGRVYKAVDRDNHLVAIKHIKFDNQEEGIPSTALRQIALIKSLKSHPNIVPLLDVFYHPQQKLLKIVFDFSDYDLKKFMLSKEYKIDELKIKRIFKKIVNGIAYCHSRHILHRDLKPQNILIDCQENVKIADFGLARLVMTPQKTLTHEIETLWYRAPEILLGQQKYTFSVDIWALGCIFVELFLRKPFFLGSGYELQQIFKIYQILGTPSRKEWPTIIHLPDFSLSFPRWPKKNLQVQLPMIPSPAFDLIIKMLQYDPEKRISAEQILNHPYLSDIQI